MSAARRYLVAGGASGIGLAFARLAASQGAAVAILDRDAAALGESGRELRLAALAWRRDVTARPSSRPCARRPARWAVSTAWSTARGVGTCARDPESTRDED